MSTLYEKATPSPTHSVTFRSRRLVAFVGNSLDFPRHNLDLVRRDLEGIEVARFASLSELRNIVELGDVTLQMLVIPECRAADLRDRFSEYESLCGGAPLVLAYSDIRTARMVRDCTVCDRVAFLPMNCSIDAWTAYVRLIVCGQEAIPHEILEIGADVSDPAPKRDAVVVERKSAELTPRESQIVELLADGMRNREIGKRLGVSEHTVKLHLHNVYGKINVANRIGAAAWYLSQRADGA